MIARVIVSIIIAGHIKIEEVIIWVIKDERGKNGRIGHYKRQTF